MPRRKRSENKRPISQKDKKFVQNAAQGMSDKKAAMDAGYSESMAENTKARIWSKPEVQEYFRRLMRAAIPPERLVSKLSEHIDAKSVHTRVRRKMGPPDAKGNRPVLEETVEKTETVDAGVSLRAIEITLKAAQYVPDGEVTANPLTLIQIEGDAVVVQKLLGD